MFAQTRRPSRNRDDTVTRIADLCTLDRIALIACESWAGLLTMFFCILDVMQV